MFLKIELEIYNRKNYQKIMYFLATNHFQKIKISFLNFRSLIECTWFSTKHNISKNYVYFDDL